LKGDGLDWVREVLREAEGLSRYDVGETVEDLSRRLRRDPASILKLNSNENFFVPIGFLRSILMEVVGEYDPRVYPRYEKLQLIEALSRYLNVSTGQIVLGAGSDQLIELISRAFLKPGDHTLSVTPTFSIYERCTRVHRARYEAVPLREDFSLDVDGMLNSAKPRTRIIFLCSPNNPTANQFDTDSIRSLLEGFNGLVVVDEAYVDFAGRSIIDLVDEYENLIVLRTFSKSFGIASLRLGYAVSNEELASTLDERFQMPYAVCSIALRVGLKLLDRVEVVRRAVKALKVERSRAIKLLNEIDGVRAFDSETNFILISLSVDSRMLYERLLEKGIIVRNLGRVLHLEDCIRVTVAPRPVMDKFITTFREVLTGGVD